MFGTMRVCCLCLTILDILSIFRRRFHRLLAVALGDQSDDGECSFLVLLKQNRTGWQGEGQWHKELIKTIRSPSMVQRLIPDDKHIATSCFKTKNTMLFHWIPHYKFIHHPRNHGYNDGTTYGTKKSQPKWLGFFQVLPRPVQTS